MAIRDLFVSDILEPSQLPFIKKNIMKKPKNTTNSTL